MLNSHRSVIASFVVVSLLALGAPASAQWWWPPTEGMSVEPTCPHPANSFDVTVSGQWPHSCSPNGASVGVNGLEIDVFVDRSPPPGICLAVITPWSRTVTVGPLPAGTYAVFATYTEAGQTVQPRVQVGQVEVSASCPGGCYPDCNQDGGLSIADFGCFQGKYVLGDPYADCNASGSLTVADFGCFQGKYVLGCP